MKTPDEIKKALKLCGIGCYSGCPYNSFECVEEMSRDALAYIKQLENHIGELTEKVAQLEVVQLKWISVKERFPEDGETVLTYKNGIFGVNTFEKNRNGWIDRGNWFWFMATVSYWMPMPQPPKEDDHADSNHI